MPILVMCKNPACGELFDAPDAAMGKRFRCPVCGTEQAVDLDGPAADAKPAATPAAAAQPLTLEPEPSAPAAPATARPAPAAQPARAPGKDDEGEIPRADEEPALTTQAEPARPSAASPISEESIEFELHPLDAAKIKVDAPRKAPPKDAMAGAGRVPKDVPGDIGVGGEDEEGGKAAGKATTKGGKKKSPAEEDIKFNEEFDELPLDGDAAATVARAEVSDGVLEHRSAAISIFAAGVIGVAVGAAVGGYVWRETLLMGLYVGGGIGWVAGFVVAFLFVLNVDKPEADKIRCTLCGNSYPSETTQCDWCGAPLSVPTFNPLAADCLHALSYATTNGMTIFWVVLLAVFNALVLAGSYYLIECYRNFLGPWQYFVYGLAGLIGLWSLGFCLSTLLLGAKETLMRSRKAPDVVEFFSPANPATAVVTVVVVAMYTLPLVTLPLLPVALLMLANGRASAAMSYRATARLAWRHAKDFTIMWLMLLLYLAGTALAVSLIFLLLRGVARIGEVGGTTSAAVVMGMLKAVLVAILAGFIMCLSGLSLLRCIGLFGRHNAAAIFPDLRPKAL